MKEEGNHTYETHTRKKRTYQNSKYMNLQAKMYGPSTDFEAFY